jgi:short-subunit dehydrogenase
MGPDSAGIFEHSGARTGMGARMGMASSVTTILGPTANPASALITGASSGIGAALAIALAAPGRCLHLQGRDATRLEEVAGRCRRAGAMVTTKLLDVRDRAPLQAWVRDAAADLVIANAGLSGAQAGSANIVAVNLQAVIDTAEAALPGMQERASGQLAVVSSPAGYRGMPSAPVYCATKAAVRVYGEALRARLHGRGVSVSVICPGFVATPMTADNPFPMPLLMSPERAASIILRGLRRRKAVIGFPWRTHVAARLFAWLPAAIADPLLVGMPSKEAI